MDLSVLIPARSEQFLNLTVQDVLSHSEAETEVVVVLDGAWPEEPIPQHPRVNVVYLPTPIGQRAATNLAARLARGTYVCKLDAHCAVSQGWDRILIDAAKHLGPDVTQIPAQKNLHVYDRICVCGKREYQGSLKHPCVVCGKTEWTQEIVWKPRSGTTTTCWTFDATPKFQYGGSEAHKSDGEIRDVMSSLGACFFMAHERFFQIGGLDEAAGSWGNFGIEIACKSWLSGGRQVVNSRCWFAHFFRVGGIGFPYEIHGSDQDKARKYSRDLWFNDKWQGQTRPLRWLVDKFWPIQGWTEDQRDALPAALPSAAPEPVIVTTIRTKPSLKRGIVYYSDCRGDERILTAVRDRLETMGLPIVAVSLKPIDWMAAAVATVPLERSYLTMFKQILIGLELIDADVVFFAEHDVLYHPSHFDFMPERQDVYYYNQHVFKVSAEDGRALHYRCSQTSGLCADRRLLLEHYRKRVELVERNGFTRAMGFEPGTHHRKERVDDYTADTWMSAAPNVDIRHGANLTPSRWKRDQFRNQRYTEGWTESDRVPGWGVTKGRFWDFLGEHTHATQQAVA